MVKNQANARQHPEAELLLFENYSHSLSTLSSKNDRTSSKKQANEQVCLFSRDYTINQNENGATSSPAHLFAIRGRRKRGKEVFKIALWTRLKIETKMKNKSHRYGIYSLFYKNQ